MSYHGFGLGQMLPPVDMSMFSSSNGGTSDAALSVSGEQANFQQVRDLMPRFAEAIVAAGTTSRDRAVRDRGLAISRTLVPMVNGVGTLYPAGWTTSQLEKLAQIDASSLMPSDADLAFGGQPQRIGNQIRTAWERLVGSLRARGRWPGAKRTVGLKTSYLTRAAVTAPTEEQARRDAEAARAKAAADEAAAQAERVRRAAEEAAAAGAAEAEALREQLRTAERQAQQAAEQARQAAEAAGRGVPTWVWVGGGAAALGLGAYLLWWRKR